MRRAAAILRAGGVVAAPTETLYGLLADATQPTALDALLRLKPRGSAQGIPLIVPDLAALAALIDNLPPLAERLAHAFWPGPLTLVLPAARGVDPRITLSGTVAVRWPGESPAASMAREVGRPLTATSANPPGVAPASTSEEVRAQLRAPPGITLHVVDGVAAGGVPSTLVAFADGTYRIVRVGAVAEADVAAVLGVGQGIDPPTTQG